MVHSTTTSKLSISWSKSQDPYVNSSYGNDKGRVEGDVRKRVTQRENKYFLKVTLAVKKKKDAGGKG